MPRTGRLEQIFERHGVQVTRRTLVWERDGFWLLYKRLEAGTFASLDRDEIFRN